MPREDERDRRDRSRSRRRDFNNRGRDDKKDDKKPEDKKSVSDAAKSGSSEQEIVSVAIRQLPSEIRERLEKLFEEGLLKEGDLDLRSITVFASLNEGLQARVMNHMESERIYVANARSKSGFLIATCDKAKTGCLDARGLGAIDPWMTALVAMATPKQKMVELKPERDWLDEKDVGPIKININVADVDKEVGQASVTVELPLSETSAAVAAKLQAMGVKSIPTNKMKFHHDGVGFLKNCHSFAFYNFEDGAEITLSARKRAGVKFKKDHTVMPKRPRTYEKAKEAAAKAQEQAAKSAAPKGSLPNLPGMPNLPKLPGLLGGPMPGMAGLPGMPGFTMPGAGTGPGAGTAPAGLAGLGLPGMPPLGKLGGLPGLPGMPPLGKLGGLPGLPPPGADPKAAAMAAVAASMPGLGLGLPGGPDPKAADLTKMVEQLGKAWMGHTQAPGLGLGLPGLPPPGADPKAAAIAMMAKAGLPNGPPGLGGPGTAPGGAGTAKSAMAAGSTPKGGGVPAV